MIKLLTNFYFIFLQIYYKIYVEEQSGFAVAVRILARFVRTVLIGNFEKISYQGTNHPAKARKSFSCGKSQGLSY